LIPDGSRKKIFFCADFVTRFYLDINISGKNFNYRKKIVKNVLGHGCKNKERKKYFRV
jgi:hypothetical protein